LGDGGLEEGGAGLESAYQGCYYNVSVFTFSFNYSGIFDFSDNANPVAHIIVSVIGNGQTCPDSDLPLKTRTLGTATDTC